MRIGTLLYTWLNGVMVGTDAFGNQYYWTHPDAQRVLNETPAISYPLFLDIGQNLPHI